MLLLSLTVHKLFVSALKLSAEGSGISNLYLEISVSLFDFSSAQSTDDNNKRVNPDRKNKLVKYLVILFCFTFSLSHNFFEFVHKPQTIPFPRLLVSRCSLHFFYRAEFLSILLSKILLHFLVLV